MRNLSEVSLRNRALVWYFIILVAIAGVFSYVKLGRMEDPTYTVRTMICLLYTSPSPRDTR